MSARIEFTWGDRLRKARRLAGLSTRDLARILSEQMGAHVSSGNISWWENHDPPPRDYRYISQIVADATGVSFDDLIAGISRPSRGSRRVRPRQDSNLRPTA